MTRLTLKLLGAPEVSLGGRVLAFPTRKALALLAYLVVEGQTQTRENLVAFFWPDSDTAHGQASLRRTLVHLRHTLGEASPHLFIERDTLGFNFSADFEADVLLLQVAWTAARAPTQADAAGRAALLAQLQAVATGYRGDFLTGFSLEDAPDFDDWASTQREAWHRRMSLVFDRLTQTQAEGGEVNEAIDATARWVAHDPLNEAAHRRLMQLHFAADDRASALRVYETCRATLARELKADPSPETEALAERIRDFGFTIYDLRLGGADPNQRSPIANRKSEIVNRKSEELPLVGRTNEHLALVTAFRLARRGQLQVVTLEGEPGIGKTRLAREFLGWATAQGADVWQGRAFETSGRLPYQPHVMGHDRIREVVYAQAGEARRRIFHRRALETLAAVATPPAELAHHALAAGLNERAFDLSLSAGDEAMRVFAVRDAINYYEQARLAAAENGSRSNVKAPIANLHEWQHLYSQLGRAYELTHQLEQAQALYQAMLALAQETRRPQLECVALNRLATLAVRDLADVETASALLHQARNLAEKIGDKVGLAETEWNLAFLGGSAQDAAAKVQHGQQALALARELGLAELIARSLNVLAYDYCYMYRWIEGEKHGLEAHSLYHALGDRAMEVDSKGITAYAQICDGRPEVGLTVARTALAMSLEIENPWGQVSIAQHVVAALLELGVYGEALKIAQQAVALARAHHISYLLPSCQFLLGRSYLALRRLEAAQTVLLEARAANEALAWQPYAAAITADLCAAYAYAHNWAAAGVYARQVVNPRQGMRPFYLWLTYWTVIEALLQAGERELADQAVQRFGERLGHSSLRYRIPYLRCLAVAAQWAGSVDQAISHLEEANRLAEQLALPGEQWPILAALGELYQAAGAEDQAREVLTQAAEIVQALADKIEDAELRGDFLAAEPIRRVTGIERIP